MKTITIKTKTNIPNFPKSEILVDGKNLGMLKGNSTQYLEVPTEAEKIKVIVQGVSSNEYDISDADHNAIQIHPNNLNTYDAIAAVISILISILLVSILDLEWWFYPIISAALYAIHYFSRKKKLSIKIEEYTI